MPDDLAAWVGSREETEDLVTAWPVAALRATLDLPDPGVQPGAELDPLWHWLYFLPTTPRSGLGRDGHARRGGFLPPVPLERRMYAGGRFEFLGPLRVGDRASRVGTVVDVATKEGRSGPLVFVTVRFEISTPAGTVLVEEQDLVYRAAGPAPERPAPGPEPVPDTEWREDWTADEVLLFRFSALTFNGHRIHYDHRFTTGAEGYPGLVVHGPLTALLLAGLARRGAGRPLRRFAFRARSPLFCAEPFSLHGRRDGADSAALSAWSHDGRLAMTAEARFG